MTIYKLGEICEYVEGYVNPKISDKENFSNNNSGHPWIKVSELIHGDIISDSQFYLSESAFNDIKKSNQIFKKGTIVWSKSGSVGLTSILGIDVSANRGVLNIIPNESKVLKKYLFYYLIINRTNFSNLAKGAVIKHLYGPELMKQQINLPTLSEQQKIIDIIEPLEFEEKKCDETIKICQMYLKRIYDMHISFKGNKEKVIKFYSIISEVKDKIETNKVKVKSLGYDGFVKKRGKIASFSKYVEKFQIGLGLASSDVPIGLNLSEDIYGISTAYYVLKSEKNEAVIWFVYEYIKRNWKNLIKQTPRQGQAFDIPKILDLEIYDDSLSSLMKKNDEILLILEICEEARKQREKTIILKEKTIDYLFK